jgi:hypothetical protein
MASIYDKPAELRLQDTYVPLPFQEMMLQANALRDNYEKANEYVDAGEEFLGKITPYGEAATKTMTGIKDEYTNYAKELASKDLTDPMIGTEIRRKVKSLASNKDVKDIMYNYAGIQEANKRLQEARKNPFFKSGVYDADYIQELNNYSKTGKTNSDWGNYSFVNAINTRKEIEEPKFDNLEPNSYIREDGTLIQNWESIAKKDIHSVASNEILSGDYTNNPQIQMDYTAVSSNPESKLAIQQQFVNNMYPLVKASNPKLTEDEINRIVEKQYSNYGEYGAYAYNRLMSVGTERVHSKLNGMTQNAFALEAYKKSLDGKEESMLTPTKTTAFVTELTKAHQRLNNEGKESVVRIDGDLGNNFSVIFYGAGGDNKRKLSADKYEIPVGNSNLGIGMTTKISANDIIAVEPYSDKSLTLVGNKSNSEVRATAWAIVTEAALNKKGLDPIRYQEADKSMIRSNYINIDEDGTQTLLKAVETGKKLYKVPIIMHKKIDKGKIVESYSNDLKGMGKEAMSQTAQLDQILNSLK